VEARRKAAATEDAERNRVGLWCCGGGGWGLELEGDAKEEKKGKPRPSGIVRWC
jgi:hypothetical protein